MRAERRAAILSAFARVLADHGYAGATITAVAAEAGVTPGLLHHHFESKQEMVGSLLETLIARFRQRTRSRSHNTTSLDNYAEAALALDETSDVVSARCWVGLFAEAVRDPALFDRMRRHLASEVDVIGRLSGGALGVHDSSAVLSFIIGALVFGAFAPRQAAGFAAPSLKKLIVALG